MKEQLSKLIDVKTIVTFSIVGTVIYLAVADKLDSTKIYELALMVVTFFFGKKFGEMETK